jgi:Suppressor of fused protein (SUFU)
MENEILDATEYVIAHLNNYIGPIKSYLGSLPGIQGDPADVSIAVIEPTETRPFYTICTVGMSNITMTSPEGAIKHIELMMCLPSEWDFQNREQRWPVKVMRDLAYYIANEPTYLSLDHTLPNGDPPEPWSKNTEMCGMLISVPVLSPPEFMQGLDFKVKQIFFLSLIPLYREEMDLIVNHGADGIYDRFEKNEISELLNPRRKNLCSPD